MPNSHVLDRKTEAQKGQGTCLRPLSEARANKSKRWPSLVEGRCTRNPELGSAAGMLCGLEEVTGSCWSPSIKWEENGRVSLFMKSSGTLNPMPIVLL